MEESQIPSLGGEDLLEKETHSCMLAWEIPWTEEPGGLQFMVLQKSDMTEELSTQQSIKYAFLLLLLMRKVILKV